ncbi:MAG TPA: coproporphyrinogen-III oxidase family protein [Polyangiaceae bacterium]
MLYVHIPFCDYICSFCALNRIIAPQDVKERYIDALEREIQFFAETPYGRSLSFRAIYIGGGTPTSLSPQQLDRVLSMLRKYLNVRSDVEFTCEGTTQSFTSEMVGVLKANGVNRVSTGIQSFNGGLRQQHLNMKFDAAEVLSYLAGIRDQFPNFNIDLIYNMPQQGCDVWAEDLDIALSAGSRHLTMNPYVHLRNTKLHTKEKKGLYPYPEQDEEIRCFELALAKLKGTPLEHQYSVRDWSGVDDYCRYIVLNSYSNDVIAFGAGAYGYIDGCSYKCFSKVDDYIEAVTARDGFGMEKYYLCTHFEKMQRYMVMGLRLQHLDMTPFQKRFGLDWRVVFGEKLADLEYSGFIAIDDDSIHTLPEGVVWGNNLRAEFAEEWKFSFVGYGLIGDGPAGRGNYV